MRLTRKTVERRCKFVAKLHKEDHERTSTDIGKLVKKRFGMEMHPSMIQKVREQAEAERLANLQPKVAAPTPPPLPAAVVEPKLDAKPTAEMVEGLKLIKQAIYKAAQAGTIKIVATKEGKVSVSYELETRSETAFEL